MSDEIKRTFETYSNERLIRLLHLERDQYLPEALAVAQEELARRNLDPVEKEALIKSMSGPTHYRREDFLPIDRLFSQTDFVLARAMMTEEGIPFFADNPQSSDIMPTQGLAERQVRLHVHRDHIQRAQGLLDEHFSKDGGAYRLKELPLRDQLKLMNFYEIQLDDQQLLETVEMDLSAQERRLVAHYARRLLAEAERLEREQERTIFYFDNLDSCVAKLERNEAQWTIADVLTILEVVQIYCDDAQFRPEMDHIIQGLLEFFRTTIADR